MFEKALYEHIKDNFTVAGFDLSFGFGDIAENTQSPYITMFVLDSDGEQQMLCDDYFSSGNSLLQWNIYYMNISNAFHIKRQLDLFLESLRTLTMGGTTYNINLVQHEPSPSGVAKVNGLAVDILAKTFNYNEG